MFYDAVRKRIFRFVGEAVILREAAQILSLECEAASTLWSLISVRFALLPLRMHIILNCGPPFSGPARLGHSPMDKSHASAVFIVPAVIIILFLFASPGDFYCSIGSCSHMDRLRCSFFGFWPRFSVILEGRN